MKTIRLIFFFAVLLSTRMLAADSISFFSKTDKDIIIDKTKPFAIITKVIKLDKTQNVLVVADGSFMPHTKNGKAQIFIEINKSSDASNKSIIDWGTTDNPQPHSFNCIAGVKLTKGTYVIKLIASVHKDTPDSNFIVAKSSGISILVNVAPNMISTKPSISDVIINQDTGKKGGSKPLVMNEIIKNEINVGDKQTNVVSLSSGNSSRICGEGDALWGIFLNNEDCLNNGSSQWSVNDILRSAELTAPMYLHSLHSLAGKNTISLKASELSFTYFENPVCYAIDKETRLITLFGMNLSGKASFTNTYCNREEWGVFGSKDDAKYPPIGIPHVVLSKEVDIPQGHNGIVLFLTKFRLQPDKNDIGGKASLWLNIDGVDVGTIGRQGFKKPNGDSSRTISASYLSVGKNALTVGKHIVKVYLKGEGDFMHIAHSLDLPLIYFD